MKSPFFSGLTGGIGLATIAFAAIAIATNDERVENSSCDRFKVYMEDARFQEAMTRDGSAVINHVASNYRVDAEMAYLDCMMTHLEDEELK